MNVEFHDGKDALKPATDQPAASSERPADWAEFAPELGVAKDDYVVTKRQWELFSVRILIFSSDAAELTQSCFAELLQTSGWKVRREKPSSLDTTKFL